MDRDLISAFQPPNDLIDGKGFVRNETDVESLVLDEIGARLLKLRILGP